MNRNKKIDSIADQIMFYSEGKVLRSTAEGAAEDYLRRKGFSSLFVHDASISSIGKKLAMRCMGKPIC